MKLIEVWRKRQNFPGFKKCDFSHFINLLLINLLQEWEEKAREEKKRYEAENKLWLEDGGAEAIKAQKIANKTAKKAAKKEAKRTNTVQGIIYVAIFKTCGFWLYVLPKLRFLPESLNFDMYLFKSKFCKYGIVLLICTTFRFGNYNFPKINFYSMFRSKFSQS